MIWPSLLEKQMISFQVQLTAQQEKIHDMAAFRNIVIKYYHVAETPLDTPLSNLGREDYQILALSIALDQVTLQAPHCFKSTIPGALKPLIYKD